MTCLNQDPNQVQLSCWWLCFFHLLIDFPCFHPPPRALPSCPPLSPALLGAQARALPVQCLQALAACFLLVPSNWFLHLCYRPDTLSLWFCVPSWCTHTHTRVCVYVCVYFLGATGHPVPRHTRRQWKPCCSALSDVGLPQEARRWQPICLGRSYLNFLEP